MSPRPVELPESDFPGQLKLARSGRFREALQSIQAAMAESGDRESRAAAASAALAEIARLAQAGGDPLTAEHALDLALELRPSYADLHFQRACLALGRQRNAEARRSLDAAVRLNPRYLAARLERALLDAREGRLGDALSELRGLGREIPVDQASTFQAGIRRLERAEWEEAEPLLKRAAERSEPDLKEPLERVRSYLEQGEAAQAMRLLREVLPRYESFPDLHYLVGLAELKLGHLDDAMASLACALELNPDFHDARVQFARTLESLGETAEAARQAALVLEQDPNHARALELRAVLAGRSVIEDAPAGAAVAPRHARRKAAG